MAEVTDSPNPNLPTSNAPAHEPPREKGLIGSVLDFTFESFVTPGIIKFLYVLALIGVVLSTLGWIFSGGFTDFIWRLVLSPIVLIVGAVLARVYIELVMVVFKILELLRRIEANQRNGSPKV